MDSISDFAENLILNQVENIREGKELPPTAEGNGLTPAGRDISKVKVPDSFMTELLGEAYHPQETPPAKEIPELVWQDPEESEEAKTPQSLTEETAQQLVPLLEEVKSLLKEMTTAGMMGVNLGGTSKDSESWEKVEKGNGYKASKASKLPGDSRKKVLKSAISAKLRKRK
mgnify:FL=1|tara:strand:- start:114 stop:626 length:513 start_codon:yes stop_codon:yes gene_type:complete